MALKVKQASSDIRTEDRGMANQLLSKKVLRILGEPKSSGCSEEYRGVEERLQNSDNRS